MEGKQKLFYLPEPHTDFIFAVTAEELGLVGAMFVTTLFAVFLWRGTRTALRTHDLFGRFLAVGITSMVILQAFINISVVLGLMPTKGIPLPFVSYGGSSLFVMLGCVGVLLNRFVLTVQTLALPTLPFDDFLQYTPSWQEVASFAGVITPSP